MSRRAAGPRAGVLEGVSDTQVYGPYTQAGLETTAHFCEVVVPGRRGVPGGVCRPPSIYVK